ncbi:fibronectin type III domain-containing protein [Ekhidna sp.]|uniref:fibronectin type III domain-containing protein n=1 Tax=Ekhidna sp. TaxID=2608089 RepID=UPI003C7DA4BB
MRTIYRYIIAVFMSAFSVEVNAQCSNSAFSMHSPTGITETSVNLSWNASVNSEGSDITYEVYQSIDGGANFTSVEEGITSTSYQVTGLTCASTYVFRIQSKGICGLMRDPWYYYTYENSSNTRTVSTEPTPPTANNESDVTDQSFVANWNQHSNAIEYYLDVADNLQFSPMIIDNRVISGAANTSSLVEDLTPCETYYYRVRARTPTCTSNNSSAVLVQTMVPQVPVLEDPFEPTEQSFKLDWNDVHGVTEYQLDVASDIDFTNYVSGFQRRSVNESSEDATGLEAGTTYYARVRSICPVGSFATSEYSEIKSIITQPDVPEPEVTYATQFDWTIRWTSVQGAVDYTLEVAEVENFSEILQTKTIAQSSGTIFDRISVGLNPGKMYYFRLKANNASGSSSFSDHKTVILPPNAPEFTIVNVDQTSATLFWESVPSATKYSITVFLDEITENIHPDYDAVQTNTPGFSLENLEEGRPFWVAIKSGSDYGFSPRNIEDSVTVPKTPVLAETTLINQTSFTVNWGATVGATEYLLDVSKDNFNTFLPGYFEHVISAESTSEEVDGLDPATTYQFRILSKNNTGRSPISDESDVLTVSGTPVSAAPNSIGQTSFTANWEVVDGADSYLVDVSSDDFNTLLSGYPLEVTGNSAVVSGLDPATIYHYRVRSENATDESPNSGTQEVLTIPATPAIVDFSERSSTSVKIEWEKVAGANTYEIIISKTSDFSELVPGNDPLVEPASLNQTVLQGLAPSTAYFIKMRSVNETGPSPYSDISTTSTTDSNGNSLDPKIEIANADVASINFNVTGGLQGIASVKLFHKKRTEEEFAEVDMEVKSDGIYFLNVQPEWLDDFGMDYRIVVEDGVGATAEISNKVLRQIDRVEINSVQSFGSAIENYSIISVPYDMSNTIEDIFERLLGEHDDSKWRIVQYRNGNNFDYTQGLSKESMTRGEGYWFISTQEIDLNIGSAIAPENTRDNLFQMSLAEGWNQVGNPYPFDIKWSDVLSHNSDVFGVSPLFVFDQSSKSFTESDDLIVYGGGFVFSENAVTLEIPIVRQEESGRGRIADSRILDGWEVKFNLKSGEVVNQLSSIGMRSTASEEVDAHDQAVLPRFVKYVEFKSLKENHLGYQLSRDYVDIRANYRWDFHVESNASDRVNITWDATQVPAGTGVFIHDTTDDLVINMKDVDSYDFKSGALLKIYALEDYDEIEGVQFLGRPYPNPIDNQLTIPFDFGLDLVTSRLVIYKLDGSIVFEGEFDNMERGLKKLEWNTTLKNGDTLGEGMYVYSIYCEGKKLNTGRIIKK